MKQPRRGISGSIVLLVIVVVVAAAFYVEIPMVSSSSTTSTLASTSINTSTTGSSTTGGSTGKLTFKIAQPLIVAPGQPETVSVSFSAIGSVSGNYTFGTTALPNGVTATFQPSSLSFPAGLSSSVTMTLTAASGAAVLNSTMNVQATAGSSAPLSQPFQIMSVQALVLIQGNSFKPSSLSVTAGTKVYWLNLDPSVSPDLGPDMHDVTATDHSFSSGTGALGQYSIYGHTFATAGTVSYESAQQGTSMTGQVTVTG